LYTVSRARLVLAASLPLLVCGLLLIYFPAVRHPAALFVVAVLVAAGSLIDPESAVVLAQASIVGLVLAVVAAALARLSARPVSQTTPVRGSSQAIERNVSEIYQRGSGSGAMASTATNPLVPAVAPEGES
jgi:hypothetical protein